VIGGGGAGSALLSSRSNNSNSTTKGPVRVFPGRLSVSRTFGDIEAKLLKLGGIPGVISAEPEIKGFKVSKDFDCIVMGCDGIYDKMSNKEVVDLVWNSARESTTGGDLHLECANIVERLLRESVKKKTLDNITCIVIAFKNLKRMVEYFCTGKLEPTHKPKILPGRKVASEAVSAKTSRDPSEET